MQWILGAVIIAATTYLGFALKARGRRRVRQLEEIVQLLQHLDTKLCYLREKLVPIMNEVKADASPEFAGLLDAYIASIDELCSLLDGLGQGDADVQERTLRHFVKRFGEYRDRAEKQFRIQSGMYPKFGFMGGLLLCILLW